MTKTQREYWQNIIGYIKASSDIITDLLVCDGNEKGAEAETEARLKFLTDNYILRRKPNPIVLFAPKKTTRKR